MAWVVFIGAVFVMLTVTGFYLVGPSLLSAYDKAHKIIIPCSDSGNQ